MTDEVIKEKVYCHGYPCGNGDNGFGMAMLASQNQWGNNPFAYAFLMGMMRFMYGNDWQNQYGGNAEMQSRFNQLSNQMSDNHNTDILADFAKGNYARIGELATNLGVDLRAIQSGICDVRSGIQGIGGDVKAGFQGLQGDVRFTGERIINASILGDKDLQATMKDCCCQSKELVQRMGYEAQLSQRDLTAALQAGHTALGFNMQQGFDRTNTGLERGFSSVAYEGQRQTCDIINAINASQQRTADLLNSHWKDEMSQSLQDEKFKNSQLQQNIYFRDLMEKKEGCGCGA